MIQNTNSATI